MIQVSIIIPQQCAVFSSVNWLYKVLNYANLLLANKRKAPAFTVSLIGSTSDVKLYGSPFSINPHYTLANHTFQTDVVMIPALAGDIAAALKSNAAFIPWMVTQFEGGAQIAGCCTGTFMLADTHLVNKKNCLRSWYVSEDFRKDFSQINFVAENIVQQEDAIATGNGAYTFFTKLLQDKIDKEIATVCASLFEAEFNIECQSVFSIKKQTTGKEKWSAKTKKDSFYIRHQHSSLSDRLYLIPEHLDQSKFRSEQLTNFTTSTRFHSSKIHSNAATLKGLFRNANRI